MTHIANLSHDIDEITERAFSILKDTEWDESEWTDAEGGASYPYRIGYVSGRVGVADGYHLFTGDVQYDTYHCDDTEEGYLEPNLAEDWLKQQIRDCVELVYSTKPMIAMINLAHFKQYTLPSHLGYWLEYGYDESMSDEEEAKLKQWLDRESSEYEMFVFTGQADTDEEGNDVSEGFTSSCHDYCGYYQAHCNIYNFQIKEIKHSHAI